MRDDDSAFARDVASFALRDVHGRLPAVAPLRRDIPAGAARARLLCHTWIEGITAAACGKCN